MSKKIIKNFWRYLKHVFQKFKEKILDESLKYEASKTETEALKDTELKIRVIILVASVIEIPGANILLNLPHQTQ